MNLKILVGTTLVAALVVVGTIFVINYTARSAEAQGVQMRAGGTVISTLSLEDALAAVSQQVGFEVKYPASVPDSLKLDFVDSVSGPEGVPNGLKLAILSYGPKDEAQSGNVNVRIEETGSRFGAPTDRAQKFDVGVPGIEAYVQATEKATGYWVFTANRGFLVTVTGPQAPGQAELRQMLASLVR